LMPTAARAEPLLTSSGGSVGLEPRPVLFTSNEIAQYRAESQRRNRLWAMGLGGGGALALVAAGVTLLALGLGREPGSSEMTTAGVGCLALATAGAFLGFELARW